MLRSVRSRRRPLRFTAGLLALLSFQWLAAPPAGATVLVELSEDQLVDRSHLIVAGTVASVHGEWRDGMLVTVADVRVDRVLAGEPVARVAVVVPGGVDFERAVPVAVTVPGAPKLVPGERTLLFLQANGPAADFAITGFSQGKLAIVDGPGGVPMVLEDLAGVALVGSAHKSAARVGEARAVPLSVIEERVARRAGRGGAGGAR